MTVLNLGYVTAVQTALGNTSGAEPQEAFAENCPPSSYTTMTFPNPKGGKNVKVVWMDGGLMPGRPEEMGEFETMALADGSGMLFVGTKGKMIAGCYSQGAKLLPVTRMEEVKIPIKYPRVKGADNGHYAQWVEACLAGYGKMETSSHFDKAALVVENMLVANLAIRGYNIRKEAAPVIASVAPTTVPAGTPAAAGGGAGRGQGNRPPRPSFPARNVTLLWDHDKMKITNVDEVNQYVKREYREGWHLSGI
jgi:hypothetical protein